MKKCFYLLLFSVLFILSYSCCSLKKFETQTEIVTVTKIDTIIKVVTDTVEKITRVEIHDTAFLENDVATARSYFDVKQQKVVLSLKGKIIDVPIVVNKIITTKKAETTVNRKPVFSNYLLAFLIGAIFVALIFVFAIIKIKLKL